MYVGTQFKARHETDIRQLAQLGVEHVDVTPTRALDGVDRRPPRVHSREVREVWDCRGVHALSP